MVEFSVIDSMCYLFVYANVSPMPGAAQAEPMKKAVDD